SEPAAVKRPPVAFVVVLVACEDRRTANDNLARLPGRKQRAVIAENRDLARSGNADRAGSALPGRQRILRNRAGLGHAVGVNRGDAECALKAVLHFRGKRTGAAEDETQRMPGDAAAQGFV